MTCLYPILVDAPSRGLCRGCATPLKRNKDGGISKVRNWCSTDCAQAVLRNHFWGYARTEAVYRSRGTCAHCKVRIIGTPEVNHIAPRYGQGYGKGCWNHQDNLEVLCHGCHVAVTGKQRAARATGGQMRMEAEA